MLVVSTRCFILLLAVFTPASGWGGEVRSYVDTACASQVDVRGIGSNVDGTFDITNKWVHNRGIYKRNDVCLSWHQQFNHWWFGDCPKAGENMGFGYMHENARCPYDAHTYKSYTTATVPGVSLDPYRDLACAQEVSVSGIDENMDGTYRMTDVWANGRGVYKKDTNPDYLRIAGSGASGRERLAHLLGQSMDSDEYCVSWHSKYRHWWITACSTVGHNQGWAWLEENVRCPYTGNRWRRGGNNKVLPTKLIAQTSFSASLLEGMGHLNKATVHMTGVSVKYGVIQGNTMSEIRDDILAATKHFITSKNILMVDVETNRKKLTETIYKTNLAKTEIRKEQNFLNAAKNSLKTAQNSLNAYRRTVQDAKGNLNHYTAKYNKARREYERQKKKASDWRIACYATGWITFGGTCIKMAVEEGDLKSQRSKLSSSQTRYNNAVSNLNSHEASHRRHKAKVDQLEYSLATHRANLKYNQDRSNALTKKQQDLSSLSVDLKISNLKLEEIVSSVVSMSVVDKNGVRQVSRMFKVLKNSIRTTINRIKEARTVLKIDSGAIARLVASFTRLDRSIVKLERKIALDF